MSVEELKAFARRLGEWTDPESHLKVIDELFADNIIDHYPARGNTPGKEGIKQFIRTMHKAAPDAKATNVHLIAEGDKLVMHSTVRGTHTGDYGSISPTGKKFEVAGMIILRIENGKAVERWAIGDMLSLLQQIGVIPEMG